MDIPVETLYELKCSRCKVYLCRGPVFLLKQDGSAVCAQCSTSERPAIRNEQYEVAAKLIEFPWCKYREWGCPVTVSHMEEAAVMAHEAECEHRQYVCPVLGPVYCDWLGPKAAILAHCRAQHPDSALVSPCTLTHDITRSTRHNYLVSAFHLLFLLHTKVCLTTGKIFHSIRVLGGSAEASDFFFNLDIKHNDKSVSKRGQVAGEGCLEIQKDTSLGLDLNSLLGVLGGFDGATFTMTVMQRCERCPGEVSVLRYRGRKGWRCESCVPARRACMNRAQGCQHTDINRKCFKHEMYFCQQGTMCYICDVRVSRGSLFVHYGSVHQDIIHRAGSTWRATKADIQEPECIVSSVAGTAMCWYLLTDSQFDLEVRTPVPSEWLSEFRCEVRVTDPATGLARIFKPDVRYDVTRDWRILVKKEEFPWSDDTGLDVCVDISKA